MNRTRALVAVVLMAWGFGSPGRAATGVDNRLGVGLGLSYGGVGLNYELGLNDYVALTAGVGLMGDSLGYNAGGRLYYPGRDATLRVRSTLLYGANAVYGKDANRDGTVTGLSAGLGAEWRFASRWSLELDVIYSLVDKSDDYDLTGSEVTVGMGVRFSL